MPLPTASPEHVANARLEADTLHFSQQEAATTQLASSDDNEQVTSKRKDKDEGELYTTNAYDPTISHDHAAPFRALSPLQPPVIEQSEHITSTSTMANNSPAPYTDTGSTYYSAQSRFSFRSIFTRSTGQQSQSGATWRQALTKTMNSGFGSGTRVREGREKGGYLPPITGVGRTGKAPAPIPPSMLRALGVKSAAQLDGSSVSSPTSEGQELERLPRRGFHNMSLEDLRLRDGTAVPIVVNQFIEAVELYGLETKGIYLGLYIGRDKIGDLGSPYEILKNNDASSFKKLDFTNPAHFRSKNTVKLVASTLIWFFTWLPEPLLTTAFLSAWVKAVDREDATTRVEYTRTLVGHLPEANHATLKVLARHLNRVIENSAANGVNVKELISSWQLPILVDLSKSTWVHWDIGDDYPPVLSTILENFDVIFGSDG